MLYGLLIESPTLPLYGFANNMLKNESDLFQLGLLKKINKSLYMYSQNIPNYVVVDKLF